MDGLENPTWLNWKPITEGQLADSGGGLFTLTTFLIKNSNFFTRYSLPQEVGIRLIAKNKDAHYTIVDTAITISKGAAGVSGALPLLLD